MLYSEEMGDGPTLLLLHGWGVNRHIWRPIATVLADRFRVVMIDLPGHGQSEFSVEVMQSIDAIADAVAVHLRDQCVVLGWSLGGLVALSLAQRYPQISRVITCASTPKFIATATWPGLQPSIFSQFSANLVSDYQNTLQRFLSLSLLGTHNARALQTSLLPMLVETPPSISALQQGLALLHDTDFRERCTALTLPVCHIFGSLDAIVPHTTKAALQQIAPAQRTVMIIGASHLPFLTHTEQFLLQVNEFIRDDI